MRMRAYFANYFLDVVNALRLQNGGFEVVSEENIVAAQTAKKRWAF